MYLGIALGLLMAFFQSLSYLCSRLFMKKHGSDVLGLFALSHIIMGIPALAGAAVMFPEEMPPLENYGLVLLSTAGFYLFGQIFLFSALADSEASRVSPLLGIKVIMLAGITVLFKDEHLGLQQWTAVFMSCISAFLLSASGGHLSKKGLIYIVLASLSYCLSDLSIKALVDKFAYLGIGRGAIFSSFLSYILCGLCGLAALPLMRKKVYKEMLLYAAPFAASWFAAMLCLFFCFALIGVVFGNILQSTRGIMSIFCGYIVSVLGWNILESRLDKKILLQRLAAAILMTAAIVLYYLGR